MKILVFDTETTGIPLHPNAPMRLQPHIIEFAAAMVDETGELLDEIVQLFDPGVKLEPIITKITGLTDADLRGQPVFGECYELLRSWFAEADAYVAHNLPFDRTMVELELERLRLIGRRVSDWRWPAIPICTVQENAEEWGRRPRLIELYEDVMGEPLAQTHRALDDVEALVQVCLRQGVFDAAAA